MSRIGAPQRARTKETTIDVAIDLDGTGAHRRSAPGCPFFDHMLDQLGRHGGFDLTVQATGDLDVDSHHTVEDVGIAARRGVPRGARRQGRRAPLRQRPATRSTRRWSRSRSTCPAARSSSATSTCRRGAAARRPAVRPRAGRALLASRSPPRPASRCTSRCARGRNTHHIVEATFKGVARCLRDAVRVEGGGVPSTKGVAVTRRAAARSPCSTTASATCARPQKALEHVGADARLTADPALIADAAGVVLPGVGAFGAVHGGAARRRARRRSPSTRSTSGRPFLGICVGMQMLYDGVRGGARRRRASASCPGTVRWLPDGVKRPQMQWNVLDADARRRRCSPALDDRPWVYFVHSLHAVPDDADDVVATCDYGGPVVAAVERGQRVRPRSSTPRSRARPACALLANVRRASRPACRRR